MSAWWSDETQCCDETKRSETKGDCARPKRERLLKRKSKGNLKSFRLGSFYMCQFTRRLKYVTFIDCTLFTSGKEFKEYFKGITKIL